jgi:protein-S-isoprenylcysteine O-methyltransferase Ste14
MMSAAAIRARADLGRLIMIPVAAVMLTLDLAALGHGARGGHAGPLRWLAAGLVCAFYLLIIWCYLRRGKAAATSGSRTAHVAAVAATMMPFAFPLLGAAPPGAAAQLASDALLIAGTAWSVWALRSLGRNLSVLAQARGLASRGPYRWVRHPLYTGELVSALGLAIAAGTLAAAVAWVALCLLQGYRAVREEQVLLQALPGYLSYRSRTPALLPGLTSLWGRAAERSR